MSNLNKAATAITNTATTSGDGPVDFLPFTRPAIERSDIEAVVRVLESGWITSGPKVKDLEGAFKERTGAKHAVAVSSATAGMHLVFHALGIESGHEVITPSMTWVSTVNLIRLSGASPVLVDIDRDTLMTDAESIEQAITNRTKLIVPVHYAGAPLDLDPIRSVANRHGIALVEDAAHALGTEYSGMPIGSSGTSIFSMQAIKNVTTAEGGVVCTDDGGLAERLRRLRFHGLAADAFDKKTSGRLANAEVVEPGFKYNLPDMNACLALGQISRLDISNAKREQHARQYIDAFSGMDAISPLEIPEYSHKHAWHLFIVRIEIDRLSIDRNQFMSELKALGIGTGIHFRAVHHHKFYRSCALAGRTQLGNTDWNTERLLTLPLFPGMSDADVERVVVSVESIVKRHAK